MITIPLYTLLFVYFIFLAIFAIFSLINFYHIISSSSFTPASFAISFFVFAITILTLYFTAQLLEGVDWQAPITIFTVDWFYAIFGQNAF